jgi:hypothetical protein
VQIGVAGAADLLDEAALLPDDKAAGILILLE